MPDLSYCRRRVLAELGSGELPLIDLAARVGRLATNVRRDLKLMAAAGLAARRREGLHVYYRATGAGR